MAATNPKKSEEVQPKRLRKNETKHVLVANTEQPHQVMSAAQAMLLVLLTLLVGTLLNSSSLYTHATTMKPGFVRDTSMSVLHPFDRASRMLGLTSLRQHTRSAMNLPRDDKVDTFTFANTKVAAPVPTTTLPQLGPTSKLTMWIIGDSLSIVPGDSMLDHFPGDDFDIQGMDGKVATGISRPDVFNWFTYVHDFVVQHKPQVLVATFGANDDQYLFGDGGAVGPFGSQAWKDEYGKRISGMLDFLQSEGTHTLWIAIPPVRDPARNDHYRIINEVTRATVAAHPSSASYVETAAAFTLPDGSYQDSLIIDGTPTLLRAPDGIHFTIAGGDVISRLVLEKLHTLYSF